MCLHGKDPTIIRRVKATVEPIEAGAARAASGVALVIVSVWLTRLWDTNGVGLNFAARLLQVVRAVTARRAIAAVAHDVDRCPSRAFGSFDASPT
eukprot:scaffold2056_cov129-Isochrysis_galbana.AAC.7